MTLIAHTIHCGVPFIIADILFTSPTGDDSMTIPTAFGNADHVLEDLPYKPAEYFQKVYIINSTLALGLAGHADEMESFLKEFRQQCRFYDQLTVDILKRILDEYDMAGSFSNSAGMISLITKTDDHFTPNFIAFPSKSWHFAESSIFESIAACGSGKEDFCVQSTQLGTFQAFAREGSLARAVSANVALLAKLLTGEATTFNSIKNFWGAGFEMIYFDGHGFQKFDNLAYVIFTGHIDQEGNLHSLSPKIVLHYRYYNDILFYSSLNISGYDISNDETSVKFQSLPGSHRDRLYIVPPLDLIQESTEIPSSFSFCTDKVAYGFGLITPDRAVFIPSAYVEGAGVNVEFIECGEVNISLQHALLEEFVKRAKYWPS